MVWLWILLLAFTVWVEINQTKALNSNYPKSKQKNNSIFPTNIFWKEGLANVPVGREECKLVRDWRTTLSTNTQSPLGKVEAVSSTAQLTFWLESVLVVDRIEVGDRQSQSPLLLVQQLEGVVCRLADPRVEQRCGRSWRKRCRWITQPMYKIVCKETTVQLKLNFKNFWITKDKVMQGFHHVPLI